eukprot:11194227-Lingulodinium_polyedra.AAC.1
MEPINARLAEVLLRGEELAAELRPPDAGLAPGQRVVGKQPQPGGPPPLPAPAGAPGGADVRPWRAIEAAGGVASGDVLGPGLG